MDAGSLLRDARRHARLTQTELAALSGTSQATLSAYERGSKTPSADTLARVLAATGVRLATVPATRRVRTPSQAALQRAARGLNDVIELASQLPTQHGPALAFPRLPTAAGRS
jgi:transcriptional regulator with XRE-family HTH domain